MMSHLKSLVLNALLLRAKCRLGTCLNVITVWGLVLVVIDLAFLPAFAADSIDYESQIQPIFTRYCVGCHGEGGGESDVSLASLKSISSGYPKGPLIAPGDPSNSKILQLMLGQEPKMPPEDELEPTKEEIELVRKWIEQGLRGESKKRPLME